MTELEQTLREWRPYGCEPVWPLMRQAANALAANDARITELTRALERVIVHGCECAQQIAREALAKEHP